MDRLPDPEDGTRVTAGNGLLEQFQPLADVVRPSRRHPVMFPPGRARLATSPTRHRITHGNEDDGDRRRRLLGGQGRWRAVGDDDINLERQLGRERREPLGLALGKSVLDHDVPALDVAELAQTFAEARSHGGLNGRAEPRGSRSGTPCPPAAPRRRAARRGHRPARSAGSGGGPCRDGGAMTQARRQVRSCPALRRRGWSLIRRPGRGAMICRQKDRAVSSCSRLISFTLIAKSAARRSAE